MIKTGYHIVDASGLNIASPGTVTGLYSKLMTALKTGKPVFMEGVTYNTTPYNAQPVRIVDAGDSGAYFDLLGGSFTCSKLDVVTSNA